MNCHHRHSQHHVKEILLRKTIKRKNRVFKSQWLHEFSFSTEYKPDKSQVISMACNSQFSVHCRGKNNVIQQLKSKQHSKMMLKFSTDRQLIITTMKSIREMRKR